MTGSILNSILFPCEILNETHIVVYTIKNIKKNKMKIQYILLLLIPFLINFSVSSFSQSEIKRNNYYRTLASIDTIFNKKEIIIRNIYKDTLEISGFQNGKLHGKQKLFYENGEVNLISNYEKGFRSGKYKIYFENGKLKEKGKYYEKVKKKDSVYTDVYDGKIVRYFENGDESFLQILEVENWKNYKRNGAYKRYHKERIPNEPTELSYLCFHKDDLITGREEFYDKTGNLMHRSFSEIITLDGDKRSQKTGMESKWKNGQLIFEQQWKNNEQNGIRTYYYENGNVKHVSNFINGELSGKIKTYYENGQLKADYVYQKNESSNHFYKGWKKVYDQKGYIKDLKYRDENGILNIIYRFENGKSTYIYISNFIKIEISEGQNIKSIECLEDYKTKFGYQMLSDEKIDKVYFNTINFGSLVANFNTEDQLLWIVDENQEYIIDTTLNEMAVNIARQYNTNWKENTFITDNFKDGVYYLNYMDGSPFIQMEFKDSLPHGNWIMYSPINNDTLIKKEYKNALPIGRWEEKTIDGFTLNRSLYHSNHKIKNQHIYWDNGNLKIASMRDSTGNQLEYSNYYENGKLYSRTDPTKDTYLFLDKSGDTTKYSVLLTSEDSIRLSRKFYSENRLKYEHRKNLSTGKYEKLFYHLNGQLNIKLESKGENYLEEFVKYDSLGKVLERGQYLNGKKQGEWFSYNSNGQTDVYYYNNDELINRKVIEEEKAHDSKMLKIED